MTRTRADLQHRKTKIIATLGPASNTEEGIRKLIQAGVNVFRLNFSHGSHEEHLTVLKRIRKVAEELKVTIGTLQDLSGPKIRISVVESEDVYLKDGSKIELRRSNGNTSNANCIYVESLDPSAVLKPGHQVLLADGLIVMETDRIEGDVAHCYVLKGARLRSRVGISFPDSIIRLPAITEKDLNDFRWGLKNEVDFVAISFVKDVQDILILRDVMKQESRSALLISKIERKVALENVHEIMDLSDGIMVARGDLGLELPLEKVPNVQKKLIEQSNYRGIPVIVATQMLHSMVTSLRPTRAEVSDIATAVMSGADTLMLSEETAIGDHPAACVEYLSRIAHEAEQGFVFSEYKLRLRDSDRATVPDAVAYAACAAAVKVNAAAIIACTETGNTARLIAKYRPQQPLYGASVNAKTLRRLSLFWGIVPIALHSTTSHQDEIQAALESVQKREGLLNGSRAIVTGGLSVNKPGSTSVLEIREMNFR
ncbi:MAG: pyruvate kinase [Bdellovibrionales bacterium]|nr:pyruvate kinase [Bdellovibrionales bacterium]